MFDLNEVSYVDVYFDSADEFNTHCQLIKGGGGALTREKILVPASRKFICMVDSSKKIKNFGNFPIPIEIIPMARTFVEKKIIKLKGCPVYRKDFITDNGNIILDVYNWSIKNPFKFEKILNNILGIVVMVYFQ